MTARWELIEGDCVEVMRGLEAGSFHAIVTDPPYGIEFMGHAWDTFKGTRTDVGRVATHVRKGRAFEAFSEEWAREAYRLLAPGGYVVAFGAPRLYHRLACGLEEAGFYVSDALLWLYGQGFPKSLNVAMAIDKRAGVEVKPSAYVPNGKNAVYGSGMGGGGDRTGGPFPVGGTPYEPVTDEARAWLGFGTGLKPAWEGAAVARKPLACSSVAANVLEHGAGALNVDACRIPVSPDDPVHDAVWTSRPSTVRPGTQGFVTTNTDGQRLKATAGERGRWPANVTLDDEAARQLDAETAARGSGSGQVKVSAGTKSGDGTWSDGASGMHKAGEVNVGVRDFGDAGGASRFFFTAKAPSSERHEDPRRAVNPERNEHPTVKPLALMRWLVRLVTPPGGRVLDPFAGSGTTVLAALREGFEAVGIERDPKTARFARVRIVGDAPLFNAQPPG